MKKSKSIVLLAAICLGLGARAADPISTGSVHMKAVTYRGDNSTDQTLHGMADVQIHYSNPTLPAGTIVEFIGGYRAVQSSIGGYGMSSTPAAGWHTGVVPGRHPTGF
jgi:hypothetical protein